MSRTDLNSSMVFKKGAYYLTVTTYRVRYPGPNSGYSQESVVPESTSTYNVNTEMTVTSRKGSTTPGYWSPAPRRPNPLPVNTFSFSQIIYGPKIRSLTEMKKGLPGDIVTKRVTSGPVGYYDAGGPQSVPTSIINSRWKEINNSLLDKIKNQKVNLAQALAERKQTADLVVGSLASLGKAYAKARKGDIVGAAKALGVSPPRGSTVRDAIASSSRRKSASVHASSRWLELQYGWKPLLSDIYGAAEAYHASRNRAPERERVKKKSSVQHNDYSTYNDGSWVTYSTSTVEVDLTAVAFFTINNTAQKTMSELGMVNPLTIAWELTPWSFVVDWFLPIGNYINSLDATLGCTFAGGYYGTFQKGEVSYTKTAISNSSYEMRYGYETAKMTTKSYTRSKMSGFPSPAFPDFKDPFSPTHFANAVALFSTNMRR